MRTAATLFSRTFSQLSSTKERQTIDYRLAETCMDDFNCYGIELIQTEVDGQVSVESDDHISESKDFVELLLRYLYENAVRMTTWRDIVADLTCAKED